MFVFGILSIIIPYLIYFILGVHVITKGGLIFSIISLFFVSTVISLVRCDIIEEKMPTAHRKYLDEYSSNYDILNIWLGAPVFYAIQGLVIFGLLVLLGLIYASVIVFTLLCIGGIISYINSKHIVKKWNDENQELFGANKKALIDHIKVESYFCIFITSVVIPYIIVNKILTSFGLMNKQSQAIKNAKGEF